MRDDKKREIEDLSIEKIKGRIFWDAIQHPLTLGSVGLATLSTIYLVTVAPFVGGALIALPVAIVSGVAGVSSVGWHWLIRGRHYIEEKGQELAELREQMTRDQEDKNFRNLAAQIRVSFSKMCFEEGIRELDELLHEYTKFADLIGRITTPIFNLGRIDKLSREAYHQGLSALSKVAESLRLVRASSRSVLEEEAQRLSTEIKVFESDSEKRWQLDIARERFALTKERISKVEAHEKNIAKLLQISDKCEGQLHLTAICIAAMEFENLHENAGEVVSRLQDIVTMAIEVQEQIKRLEGFNAAGI
ncbi:MAG: hypothetical protein A2827_01480 [Candidatus Spechtbacteria bacterium RIFCSPHIGHO2_01_FULL_43_30]|uniref:Uncharacterized protein n=1 Tax=Candidatus Spechtbacteria bacterium RIFCSPHIGHO2_01_FULL_43_30 TaxID=1802158 RepID=A0A1G2H7S7_9BACT|nr:MAG: hypothetical protein A2827_01480 [Candidatus Spechtbacteria bacterium RIFCSPHIGHO2_01_FULL_43_30]